MAAVTVDGLTIKIATSGVSRGRLDSTDRGRSFDGTYRASVTGGATRDWHFSTPPVSRAIADSYESTLAIATAQMCSGDIIAIPTMCCAEITGWTPIATPAGHYVILEFTLHEVQPAKSLLRYAPGDTLTGESFSRATTANYLNAPAAGQIAGILTSAAINAKRDAHHIGGVRSLFLEGAGANLCLQSENFGTTWAASGTPTRTPAAHTGSGVTLDLLGDDDVGGLEFYTQTITFTGDGTKAISIHCLKGLSPATSWRIDLVDSTGPTRAGMTVSWAGTAPTVVADSGATNVRIEPLAGDVYRISCSAPGVVAANANTIRVFPVITGTVGDVYLGGVQAENALLATSYKLTTTASVARALDSYSLPFTPPPGETSFYVKFVETGTLLNDGVVFEITPAAHPTNPYFLCNAGSGVYRVSHVTAAGTVSSTLAAAPALGDIVELVIRLFGDGSVDITQSINGGAATSGAQSATLALGTAWGGQTVYLNSAGTAGAYGFTALQSFKIVAGSRSLAEMRGL